MSKSQGPEQKPLQWRLEWLAYALVEGLACLLPGNWAFRMGECIAGLAWCAMPKRRKIVRRNLRIIYGDLKSPEEIARLAKATFRRSGGNLISAAHTAGLSPKRVQQVMHVENLDVLVKAQAQNQGVVLLVSHMGNWELLSRLVHFFPEGSNIGGFYRPLNNPILDKRVLDRRQADGCRMFSKRDPFHQVTGFLRDGGIVGVLADQRVGIQGEVVDFFGRLTRASPLPSLLARRAKANVVALSLVTERPGKWRAVLHPVETPYSTTHCMRALETAMRDSIIDVFWLQERWKIYLTNSSRSVQKWFKRTDITSQKPHRALIWLTEIPENWVLDEEWRHPDICYEIVRCAEAPLPIGQTTEETTHTVSRGLDAGELAKQIAAIDARHALPVDFILSPAPNPSLQRAAKTECIPVFVAMP